jgi:alpha-tubulin suppressor-like RCC1 family protein
MIWTVGRKVAVAAAMLLGLGLLAGCELPALVLHGSITDDVTGDAVPGLSVRVYAGTSETLVAETVADSTGRYRFYDDQLADGSYHLRFGESEWHQDASSWIDATPVAISGGARVRVDAVVDPEVGTLTGTVSNGTEPLVSVAVEAISTLTGAPISSSYTDTTGTYVFEGLSAGEYWIRAGAEGLASSYLGGTTTRVGATAVTVDEGGDAVVGDLVLSPANRVDVRLLDQAVDGEPVPDITVVALIDGSLAEPLVWNISGANGIAQILPLATDTYYFVLYDPTGTYPVRLVNDGGVPVAFPVGTAGDFQQLDIDLSTGQIITAPAAVPAALALGSGFTCALDDAGAVGCWGNGLGGQASPPPATFRSIDAGGRHVCGITTDDEIACWGQDTSGESSPPPGEFVDVTAGSNHSCALDAVGEVTCWGNDALGQLAAPDGPFAEVEAGYGHTCAATSLGAVTCWGQDDFGQSTAPPDALRGLTAGAFHSCGLTDTGQPVCWGVTGRNPQPGTYTSISAGFAHSCGIAPSGAVLCGGSNSNGQTDAPGGAFTSVVAGPSHNCAIATDGGVACWGTDTYGESSPPSGAFTTIDTGQASVCGLTLDGEIDCMGSAFAPPPGSFVQLSYTSNNGCGRTAGGTLTCWGWNDQGQNTAPPGVYADVSTGGQHACAVETGPGTVTCWGRDDFGQAGAEPGEFTSVSAGGLHSCGLLVDQTIRCWGSDAQGRATPPPGTFTGVSAGAGHTCAIATDGTLACWGQDSAGVTSPPPGTYTSVTSGAGTSCARATSGESVCWGVHTTVPGEQPAFTSAGDGGVCALLDDETVRCSGSFVIGTWFD